MDPVVDAFASRFSFKAWTSYETTVAEWLKVYPQPYYFTPKNRSVETVLSRLRDAVRAKLSFNYPSAIVDQNALALAWPEVVVSLSRTKKGVVRIGRREPRNFVSDPLEAEAFTTKTTLLSPTLDILRAVALLINTRAIALDVIVTQCDPGVRAQFMAELPDYLNVASFPANPDDPLGPFVIL